MSIKLEHGMANRTAEEFILAAVHLGKCVLNSGIFAPAIVCFAFFIELHIKSLLALCGIDHGRKH